MNIHKISAPSFEMLKRGLFIVISMLATVILYYNLHTPAEKFLYARPVARLMVTESVAVLLIVIMAAFVFDAAVYDRKNG